jgi:2-succinyl-6-hydroxy-2,4-cyclohexadiene-1-carboxylate synthase
MTNSAAKRLSDEASPAEKSPCAIVFLHGFLGAGADWREIAKAVATAKMPCYTPDLPGHGLPAANLPEQTNFTSINAWLKRYLHQHRIKRYILVGYSLGGRIALYHAAQQPEGLCGLILESCHPGLTDEQSRRERFSADLNWSKRFAREPIDSVLDQWYQQPVFASLDPQQRLAMVARRSHAWGNNLAVMLSGLSLAKQPDLNPWLQQAPLPIHYLCGSHDEKFVAIGRDLAAQCPSLTLHCINDAGHNTHDADPLQFNQVLNHAIQGITKSDD